MKLRKGMKLKCVENCGFNHWVKGKVYVVDGALKIYDEDGLGRCECNLIKRGNLICSSSVKFEEVEEMFEKKDMENGMICEQRCGTISIWLNGEHYDLISPKNRIGNFTSGVTNDLLNGEGSNKHDIVAVYSFTNESRTPEAIRGLMDSDLNRLKRNMNLVWERKEKPKAEIKLQEAKEELIKAEESLRKAREKVERLG